MLREAKLVTLSVLETLLSFIAGPKLRSKSNNWWFVSKLVNQKRMVYEDAKTNTYELEKAHAELQFLLFTLQENLIALCILRTYRTFWRNQSRAFRTFKKCMNNYLDVYLKPELPSSTSSTTNPKVMGNHLVFL